MHCLWSCTSFCTRSCCECTLHLYIHPSGFQTSVRFNPIDNKRRLLFFFFFTDCTTSTGLVWFLLCLLLINVAITCVIIRCKCLHSGFHAILFKNAAVERIKKKKRVKWRICVCLLFSIIKHLIPLWTTHQTFYPFRATFHALGCSQWRSSSYKHHLWWWIHFWWTINELCINQL